MGRKQYKDGCVVEISNKNKDGDSCSGILLDSSQGIVLTHASVLTSIFAKNSKLINNQTNSEIEAEKYARKQTFWILLEEDNKNASSQVKTTDWINSGSPAKSNSGHDLISGFEWFAASVIHFWKCDEFAKTTRRLFAAGDGWKFHEDPGGKPEKTSSSDEKAIEEKVAGLLMSYFLLLKLKNYHGNDSSTTAIFPAKQLKRGLPMQTVSTPFGNLSPPVFFNSVSQGLVSGVAGLNNELILTDARCIPGAQGGPLYTFSQQREWQLAGMVILPMCWKSSEWMGLTIGCSLSSILESLDPPYRLVPNETHSTSVSMLSTYEEPIVPDVERWSHSVVFLRSGNSWGTGVVVCAQQGLIVTCSHVVKAGSSVRVRFNFSNKLTWSIAEVVYAVKPGDVFDLAILKIKKPPKELMRLQPVSVEHSLTNGTAVYMLGHALFDQHPQLPPLVTRGVISRIAYNRDKPVLIQASCAVNAGASGGPLFSEDGHIIGIVTCNAKDTSTGASYPHINLSVPMTTVWPIIQRYINTSDASGLDHLHVDDKHIKALWLMQIKLVSGMMKSKL